MINVKTDKIIVATRHQKDAKIVINCLKKGKNKLFSKNSLIDFEIMQNNISAPGLSRFFMDITDNFFVMVLIHTSSLYDDILFSQKMLGICKNSFIVMLDDTNSFSDNCALCLSDILKTTVLFYKGKKFTKALRKDIIKFTTHPQISLYQEEYPDTVLKAITNLKNALAEKNEFLSHLAPMILTSSKADLTKISKQVGFDILDNLKILKCLCVAMEFLNDCGIKKIEISDCIRNADRIFAQKTAYEIEKLKTKQKSFAVFCRTLKCPLFINEDK